MSEHRADPLCQRTQVEALRAPVIDDYSGGRDAACIDVLALIDGAGEEL